MALIEESKIEGDCFQDAARIVCKFFQVENLFEEQIKVIKAFSVETMCSFVPVLGMESLSFSNPSLCLPIFYWIK